VNGPVRSVIRIAIALLPLALAAALISLAVHDRIDFGAGERDLVLVLAWILWSVLFAASSFALWRRGRPMGRSAVSSAVVATVGVLLTALLLALLGQLGVAGRF
jgi:hypothetical protein